MTASNSQAMSGSDVARSRWLVTAAILTPHVLTRSMNWAPLRSRAEVDAKQAQLCMRQGVVEIITVIRIWLGAVQIAQRLTVKGSAWKRVARRGAVGRRRDPLR